MQHESPRTTRLRASRSTTKSGCCSTACARWRASRSRRAPSTSTARPSSPGRTCKAINELGLNAMFMPEAYGGAPHVLHGLPGLRARDQPGLRRHRHHLGHQLPRHEAADRLGHRGAEAAPAAAHRRGRPRRAGDHRARRRLRRDRHAHHVPRGRRRDRHQRRQDLHHQRRRGRPVPAVRQVGGHRRREGEHLGADPGEGHAGAVGGAPGGQDGHARLEHGDARLRQLPRAARQPARASRATG